MSSASMNKVIILGTLGKDAESKFIPSGKNVCTMSVATNSRYKSGDEWKEETEWHKVTYWNGENIAQYLVKGQQVLLEGRIHTHSYDKDGETRYSTEIVADRLQLIGKKSDSTGAAPAAAPATKAPAAPKPAASRAPRAPAPAAPAYDPDQDVPF